MKKTNQNYSNYCSLLNCNAHWVDKLWTGSNHEWIIQTTDFLTILIFFSQFWVYISEFWLFSQNCVIQSHNSDFFSQNCVIQSHNYDFFSQNCKFISHRFLTIFAQLLVISPVYKRQIFSQNCNNSDFISHNCEFIFRNCEFVSRNCVFLWLSGRALC